MNHFTSLILDHTPVVKSLMVGTAATVGATVEHDWRILAIGAVLQLGMAAITAFAAKRRAPSRGNRRKKNQTNTHQ